MPTTVVLTNDIHMAGTIWIVWARLGWLPVPFLCIPFGRPFLSLGTITVTGMLKLLEVTICAFRRLARRS